MELVTTWVGGVLPGLYLVSAVGGLWELRFDLSIAQSETHTTV